MQDIHLTPFNYEKHFIYLLKWLSDRQLMRYWGMEPMSETELNKWVKRDDCRILMITSDSQEVIGNLNFYSIEFKQRTAPMGILIDPQYQNKGFGKKALALGIEYAKQELNLIKLTPVYVEEFNTVSKHLLESFGFKLKRHSRKEKRFYYELPLE